jgi:uracil phosphoribosyltransferase
MSLRVIVPPHPLMAHWLTVLRDTNTPTPLYASAMKELGRWLSYEAIRDWIPQRPQPVQTNYGQADGFVIDASAPLLVMPVLTSGLGLWAGGQEVLPNSRVVHLNLTDQCLVDLPKLIGDREGVMIYDATIATGEALISLLTQLQHRGVSGQRVRIICALAAAPGLKEIAEQFPQLTIYSACIDAELNSDQLIVPGIGNVTERLYGISAVDFVG